MRYLVAALRSILFFFLRLIRDIWLRIWNPIRAIIVRYSPLVIGALIVLWTVKNEPLVFNEILTFVIAGVIIWYGFRLITKGLWTKKK